MVPAQLSSGNIQDPGSANAGTSVTVTCVPGWLWSDNGNTKTVQCSNSGSWNIDFAIERCSSKFMCDRKKFVNYHVLVENLTQADAKFDKNDVLYIGNNT